MSRAERRRRRQCARGPRARVEPRVEPQAPLLAPPNARPARPGDALVRTACPRCKAPLEIVIERDELTALAAGRLPEFWLVAREYIRPGGPGGAVACRCGNIIVFGIDDGGIPALVAFLGRHVVAERA